VDTLHYVLLHMRAHWLVLFFAKRDYDIPFMMAGAEDGLWKRLGGDDDCNELDEDDYDTTLFGVGMFLVFRSNDDMMGT
jgi:hypothetical protein